MKLNPNASINFMTMKKNQIPFYILLVSIVFSSCFKNPLDVEVDSSINLALMNFEKDLYQVNDANLTQKLPELQKKYPKLVAGDIASNEYQQSLLREINNPLNVELFKSKEEYGMSNEYIQKELNRVLSYYNHYYQNDKIEKAYTFISGLHMSLDPIMLDSNSIVISIDKYYGDNYPVYAQTGYFNYQTQLMTHEFFPMDLARYIALSRFESFPENMTLLETMIYLGKIEYFIEALNPKKNDKELFGFTKEQMEYCTNNESRIWVYLVEKEKLYSKDMMEIKNYTENRPFISSMEKDSPGRMGVWYGKNIVREYVNQTGVSLQDLMHEKDYLKIFQKAKYRP